MIEQETSKEGSYDIGRVEQLLGPQFNPTEVQDIFSYYRPEEIDNALRYLQEDIDLSMDDEARMVAARKSWLTQMADLAPKPEIRKGMSMFKEAEQEK